MRTNLKLTLASMGTAALLASLAVPATAGYYYAPQGYYAPQDYYAPHYGYGYFGHSPYYYRGGGALRNPSRRLDRCVRQAFPQCSGGN
jgi:hypothetical protein